MTGSVFAESASAKLERSGDYWLATILKPGKGASATYSESVIRRDISRALPKGTHCYITHPKPDQPDRDPMTIWGTLAESAYWDEDAGVARAKIKVRKRYAEDIEELAPHVGLSIWMSGEKDDEGNALSFTPSVTNSVDLVSYGGVEGAGLVEKLRESLIADGEKRAAEASADEKREKEMATIEEVAQSLADLKAKFDQIVAGSVTKDEAERMKREAKESAEADAAKDAAEVRKATAEALQSIPADLPESLRESLVNQVIENGVTKDGLKPLVEQAKSVVDDIKKQFTESRDLRGSFVTANNGENANLLLGGF